MHDAFIAPIACTVGVLAVVWVGVGIWLGAIATRRQALRSRATRNA